MIDIILGLMIAIIVYMASVGWQIIDHLFKEK